ncbi:hypothetical protein HMPREF0262_02992 [Clostridium sp. ATCC 29733]|nr:hypothetical protein HMPREF0262_02992 [Clostridium sp. ATCC 29733]
MTQYSLLSAGRGAPTPDIAPFPPVSALRAERPIFLLSYHYLPIFTIGNGHL